MIYGHRVKKPGQSRFSRSCELLAFLPVIFLICLSVIVRRYYVAHGAAAILLAAALTIAALVGMTEFLSRCRALSFYPVLTGWLLLTIPAVLMVVTRARPKFDTARLIESWRALSLCEKLGWASVIVILAITGITAVVSMPNTWDSLCYHLARVEHWMQNRTLAFYPVADRRHLYMPPGAEMVIAHLWILGAGPSAANLVQWSAMLGSLIGVFLVAGQLGAGRWGQLLAVISAATLPMGILQSVSTQTDYAEAFWAITCIYFLIQLRRDFHWAYVWGAGLSWGLAVLTKGNGLIFTGPFVLWSLAGLWGHKKHLALVTAALVLCLAALNAGHSSRNARLFGSITFTHVPLVNATIDPQVVWGNVLRNFGLQIGTPWEEVNHMSTQALSAAAHWLGGRINDPRAMYASDEFSVPRLSWDEDDAADPVHAVLFSLALLIAMARPGASKGLRWYAGLWILAGLLFCAVARWQPWNSRFHLPLFIVFCPLFGALIGRWLNAQMVAVLAGALVLCSLPWLFYNKQHPWFGPLSIWHLPKQTQFFYKRPGLLQPYFAVAAALNAKGCTQVGLDSGPEDWQYPLWVLLNPHNRRIEYVKANNVSGHLAYPLGDFSPCAIVSINESAPSLIFTTN